MAGPNGKLAELLSAGRVTLLRRQDFACEGRALVRCCSTNYDGRRGVWGRRFGLPCAWAGTHVGRLSGGRLTDRAGDVAESNGGQLRWDGRRAAPFDFPHAPGSS